MAEYYAVLSKAVAGLDGNGADARRAVYDKARNALIGQLKAIDPPLPTAEISRQRLELEEAIRRVERETSTVPSGSPVRVAGKRPERPPAPSPQDVFRRAIQEAESAGDSQRVERASVAARADDWSIDRPPPPKPAPQYLPSQGYVEEKPRADEPRLAPDYDYDWDPKKSPQPTPRASVAEPVVDSRDRDRDRFPASNGKVKGEKRGKAPRRADMEEVMDRPVRPSRLPMILLLILIVGMVGGISAFAYANRARLAEVIHSFDGGSATSATPVADTTPAPAADTSGKDTDRLLPGQQDASAASTRVVTAPAATGTASAPNSNLLPDAGTQQASTAPADADSLVAQHATLYEEPLNQAAAANGVVAINAAVTWSFVASGPEGPEVVGNIDVPERNLKIKLTVRKNSDQSLPASHVVEIVLTVPNNFPGKAIRDVPRLVLKPAEDARGQPLIGASAKVDTGFFWIALSGENQDVAANLKLLKDRDWFDLPLLYDSGQRAILTFEKGTPGERVFDKAIAAWTG